MTDNGSLGAAARSSARPPGHSADKFPLAPGAAPSVPLSALKGGTPTISRFDDPHRCEGPKSDDPTPRGPMRALTPDHGASRIFTFSLPGAVSDWKAASAS